MFEIPESATYSSLSAVSSFPFTIGTYSTLNREGHKIYKWKLKLLSLCSLESKIFNGTGPEKNRIKTEIPLSSYWDKLIPSPKRSVFWLNWKKKKLRLQVTKILTEVNYKKLNPKWVFTCSS